MKRSKLVAGLFVATSLAAASSAQAGNITWAFTNSPGPAVNCGPVDIYDRCTNALQHSSYLGGSVEEIDFQEPVIHGSNPVAINVPGAFNASGGSVVTVTTVGGGASIQPGQYHESIVNVAAAPWNNYTQFLSVPSSLQGSSSGEIRFQFGDDHTYLGFNWGSVDGYNSVAFYSNSVLLQSFTGTDLLGGNANGGQMSVASNGYVDFFLKGGWTFDEVRLLSTNRAFEVDNFAFGDAVPAPMSAALLGLGLLGFGRLRRRV
jgi:hypothetical protein